MNDSAPRACEALIPAFGKTCGELWPSEDVRRVRGGCVHEHIRDGWACELHIESVANGFCLECYEADGHECPIMLMPVEAVTS